MPRPIWTGAISFGLVNIPIRVVSATENHNINFHQVHLEDMASLGVESAARCVRATLCSSAPVLETLLRATHVVPSPFRMKFAV